MPHGGLTQGQASLDAFTIQWDFELIYCFPLLAYVENPSEYQEGGSRSNSRDATLAYPELVPIRHYHDSGPSTGFSGRASSFAQQTRCEAPSPQEPESSGASLIRKALKQFKLCELSENLIMASWRNNTQKR